MTIPKWISLLVLGVLVLSIVPAALADSGSRSETRTKVKVEMPLADAEVDGEVRTEVDSDGETRTRIRGEIKTEGDRVKEFREEIREKNGEIKELRRELKEERRVFHEEKREEYQRFKEKHREAREDFEEHRKELQERKRMAKECAEESDECHQKKDELKRGVKQHLVKTIEVIDRSLEKLANRVEDSEALSAAEQEQALSAIAALEVQLTAQKQQIEALLTAEGTTNAQLRTAIQDLKHLWQDVRKEQRWIVAQLIRSKLDQAVEKHVEYETTLQAKIEELKSAGKDTTALQAIYDRFVAEVAELNRLQAEAELKWSAAAGDPEKLRAWKQAQEAVREQVKETKRVLREFMSAYRQLKATVSVEEEIAVETPVATVTSEAQAEATAEGGVQ